MEQLDTFKVDIVALESSYSTLKNDYISLESKVETLESKNEEAESKYNALEGNITALQRKVETLESKNDITSTPTPMPTHASTCAKDNEYPVLDLSQPFQPLIVPDQVFSNGTKTQLTMNYDLVSYKGPSFTTILRLYTEAGKIPKGVGPTLHVEQGGFMDLDL